MAKYFSGSFSESQSNSIWVIMSLRFHILWLWDINRCLGNQYPLKSNKALFQYLLSCLILTPSKASKFVFKFVRSLWNLTGVSAAVLPMRLSNFIAMRRFKLRISRLRDLTRSYDKTSYQILNQSRGSYGTVLSIAAKRRGLHSLGLLGDPFLSPYFCNFTTLANIIFGWK